MGKINIMEAIMLFFLIYCVVPMVVSVFITICQYKIFKKAHKPGWSLFIPIYNVYQMFDFVYGNGMKFLLLLIPIYNIIVFIKLYIKMAHAFGQSTWFGIGLLLVNPIFSAILAFKKDIQYMGPVIE